MQEYKNILVIKLGALGDFTQMTGWYVAIRHRWPNARITLMTNRAFFKLAQMSGYFDEYIEDNRTWNPIDYVRIVSQLLVKNFDLIIDLQMQARTKQRYYGLGRLLTKMPFAWATVVVGGFEVRYTPAKKPFSWGKESCFKIDFVPELASLSFCKASDEVLSLLPKRYVLLIPGCSPAHPYKRWPASAYRALALKLAQQDIFSVVLGTSAEQKEIQTICMDNEKAINFCNKSKLMDIPEIAARSVAVIGNDTGPQHMAELSDIPVITLFCSITKSSAVVRANVTNLIKDNIADISVDEVLNLLQSLWHKA